GNDLRARERDLPTLTIFKGACTMLRHWIRQRGKHAGQRKNGLSLCGGGAKRGAPFRPPFVAAASGRIPTTGFQPTFVVKHSGNRFQAVPADFGSSYGYTPAQIRTAYGIDKIAFGGGAGTGAGQTIAIVDAYNDPNIFNDTDTFDRQFGLTTT